MTQEEAIDKGYKEFKGEGYTVMAHPKSCFFCEHCTDIIYDYSNGPYMFICNNNIDSDHIELGLKGMCDNFKGE